VAQVRRAIPPRGRMIDHSRILNRVFEPANPRRKSSMRMRGGRMYFYVALHHGPQRTSQHAGSTQHQQPVSLVTRPSSLLCLWRVDFALQLGGRCVAGTGVVVRHQRRGGTSEDASRRCAIANTRKAGEWCQRPRRPAFRRRIRFRRLNPPGIDVGSRAMSVYSTSTNTVHQYCKLHIDSPPFSD